MPSLGVISVCPASPNCDGDSVTAFLFGWATRTNQQISQRKPPRRCFPSRLLVPVPLTLTECWTRSHRTLQGWPPRIPSWSHAIHRGSFRSGWRLLLELVVERFVRDVARHGFRRSPPETRLGLAATSARCHGVDTGFWPSMPLVSRCVLYVPWDYPPLSPPPSPCRVYLLTDCTVPAGVSCASRLSVWSPGIGRFASLPLKGPRLARSLPSRKEAWVAWA